MHMRNLKVEGASNKVAPAPFTPSKERLYSP